MTCRDDVLAAARLVVGRNGVNQFPSNEIMYQMRSSGSEYKTSGILTHVTSRMCRNAPKHHAKKYDDFERNDHDRWTN